jgi:FkbH-like protein
VYETEANDRVESSQQLSAAVLSKFAELRDGLQARTLLPWSEHCTECVWPTCYTTCELYAPREDGRCRRFVDGMVRINAPDSVNSYLLKISFKRWGKLWSPGSSRLFSVSRAASIDRWDGRIGATLQDLPVPGSARNFFVHKRYSYKKRRAQWGGGAELPTSFLLECFNPEENPIDLSLTIRSADEHNSRMPFQTLISLAPGFQRVRIPVSAIQAIIDLDAPFNIELIPNEVPDGTTLYFGLMDFVRESAPEPAPEPEKSKPVKCVVWDLDNTVWDGILVEDGGDKLRLKPGVAEIIRELDRRGILNSIASKNNPGEPLEVLKRFGVDEYFLFPQISWGPKSEAMKAIAAELNIGLDALLFVDDSDFELDQVKRMCPGVRVLKADAASSLLERKDCQVAVTAESASRRIMYREESVRRVVAEDFKDDYLSFLKSCDIRIGIHKMSRENLQRVHELTQRTNQMNFSGHRYDRKVLEEVLKSPHWDTYVLDCKDRFGSYGVVGFSIVDRREPRMTDLMFSCRIQSKRLEHAFLAFLIKKYAAETGRDFWANYRKTPRNAPSGKVFEEMGLEEVATKDGITSLVFRAGRPVAEDGIAQLIVDEQE